MPHNTRVAFLTVREFGRAALEGYLARSNQPGVVLATCGGAILRVLVHLTALALIPSIAEAQSATPAPRPSAAQGSHDTQDILILRDGTTRSGVLLGCAAESCSFDGVSVTRAAIMWAGLRGHGPNPPAIPDLASDTVFLTTLAEISPLVGVSDQQVVTGQGSHPRDEVRWIYMASPQPGQTAKPAEPATEAAPRAPVPTPQGPAKASARPTPGPGPSPTPRPSRSPSPKQDKPGPDRGALWIGTIKATDFADGKIGGEIARWGWDSEVQVRLREYRYPLLLRGKDRIGTFTVLEPEGTTLHESSSTSWGCSGEGVITFSVEPNAPGYAHASTIYLKTVRTDAQPGLGFDPPLGVGVYILGIAPRESATYVENCPQKEPHPRGYVGVVVGRSPLRSSPIDRDTVVRTLESSNGRMRGSYHTVKPESDYVRTSDASWDICREGVDCSALPAPAVTPSPAADPCGSTANEDALLSVCRDQERALEQAIAKLMKAQRQEAAEAQAHLADFKLAANLCKLWDKTKELLEALIAGPEVLAGLSPEQAAEVKEFQETVKLLSELADKAANGDNPLAALAPEQITDLQEKGEKLNKLLAAIDVFLAGYTPESAAKVLEECGAPIPEDLYRSAEQYVEHLKASVEQLQEINPLLNDLRSKDEECLPKQFAAWEACVRRAQCKGQPPAPCDPLKPPGNWVAPQ